MIAGRLLRASERTYERAVEILDSRRRPQRPNSASPNSARAHDVATDTPQQNQLKGRPNLTGMREWLVQIGHESSDINRLNIIHVAGTKGKGSTCAFTESLLRSYGARTGFPAKTGLYTSPHLVFPEERIRLDFKPISRGLFAKYFFEVWDPLTQDMNDQHFPRYLQLMALTAFHAFIREKVEATIVETHAGGEYDATNFIDAPLVTMITPLGMDHVQQLGPSIENIAWHKAGIFKVGARAFSARQDPEPSQILRERASRKGISLQFIGENSNLPAEVLQLKPDVQKANCALALAGAQAFVEATQHGESLLLLPEDISEGIKQFSWPGRFQTIEEETSCWYLDGAHNEMSIVKAAEWYTELISTERSVKKVLIFGHVSEHRDALNLLKQLAQALSDISFDRVIFTHAPHVDFHSVQDSLPNEADLNTLTAFADTWREVKPFEQISITLSVKDAIDLARTIGLDGGMQTLITGSQYLVGGAIFHMNYEIEKKRSPSPET